MELKQIQAVVDAHAITQHNGAQNASDLITTKLVNGRDDSQPDLRDDGAIKAPVAPKSPPLSYPRPQPNANNPTSVQP